MNALLRDVQIMLKKEECALGMEQRSHGNNAAVKDVQNKPKKEEFVLATEQSSNAAAAKDAQTMLLKEECA
jgi:hypothetical protein